MRGFILTLLLSFILFACDPGYECDYYIENQASGSINYRFFWRYHDQFIFDGDLEPNEREFLTETRGIGIAHNEFLYLAESLFINDTIRINVKDTILYRADKVDDHYGEYTLIISQELISPDSTNITK